MRLKSAASIGLTLALAAVLLPSAFGRSPAPAQENPSNCVKAGFGEADATWNVGVSAGQYATDSNDDLQGSMDPHVHHVKQVKSYGVHSRLFIRAIVVEGCNGERVALIKNDNYLAQDMLQRRVAQILAEKGSGVSYEHILTAATHNHSSPYVYSMMWGVAVFQDVFDIRAFEFQARKTAEAILEAEASLAPALMGATTVHHDIYKANIVGPDRGDDGTPAGYPRDFGDEGVVVMRFDNAETGAPIATWVNHGQHPESLDGYNLITADYLAPLQRYFDRETGSPMVFSQGDVGSAEGPYDGWDAAPKWLKDGTRRAWAHTGYAQAERGARYLADSMIQGYREIGNGGGTVPYSGNFEVDVYENSWIPGPASHPYPSVWNCKTESNVTGDPNGPGLPTCGDVLHEAYDGEPDPAMQAIYQGLREAGVPVPEHGPMNGPGHGAVEENNRLHLQVFKIGDVVLGSCACEAQVDLILNFESRADNVAGNMWDGYDFDGGDAEHPENDCVQEADSTWTCNWSGRTENITDYEYRRMKAQIHNPADGWDALDYIPFANSEPYDTTQIKGNFTRSELSPEHGYKLAVGVGHASDYNGYTVSYREYMNRDHYRKALTSYGPHTADYMATRMSWMAGALNGGPDPIAEDPYYNVGAADEARQVALATALGQFSSQAYDEWLANLPNDKNPAQILTQPKNIQRFDAASFSWTGGSNAIDNPVVVVQRRNASGEWVTYGDQTGDVQTFLEFPEPITGVLETWQGEHEWHWTANFEAFNFGPNPSMDPRGPQVPEGEYRFLVNGKYQEGGAAHEYELASDQFTVSKWQGIKVGDLRLEDDGTVSFTVSGAQNARETEIAPGLAAPQIRYPRTYDAADVIRFIRDDNGPLCKTCSFRPWAAGSNVASATVTVEKNGSVRQLPATLGSDGRWRTASPIYRGESAYVERGGIVDTFGEINGERSGSVEGNQTPPRTLTSLSLTTRINKSRREVTAQLLDASNTPISGAAIRFFADGRSIGQGTTGADGRITLAMPSKYKNGSHLFEAIYDGNENYEPSSGTVRT